MSDDTKLSDNLKENIRIWTSEERWAAIQEMWKRREQPAGENGEHGFEVNVDPALTKELQEYLSLIETNRKIHNSLEIIAKSLFEIGYTGNHLEKSVRLPDNARAIAQGLGSLGQEVRGRVVEFNNRLMQISSAIGVELEKQFKDLNREPELNVSEDTK